MENSDVPCPICGKDFPVKEIEQHASRCLFFNSNETTSPSTSKRAGGGVLESQPKRTKLDEAGRLPEVGKLFLNPCNSYLCLDS